MSILKILTFPDPRLREVAKPVKDFGAKIKKLAEEMLETMYDAKGIGLAAPQVGELVRMLVIDTRPRDEKSRRYDNNEMAELESQIQQPLVMINPEIVKGEGQTTFDEGCLSIPGYYETVERFDVIEIKFNDVNGKEVRLRADGLLAICMQHEMDHLEGTLFIDHLSFVKSNKIKTQIKKHGYAPKKTDEDEADKKGQPFPEKEKVPLKAAKKSSKAEA